MSPPEIEELEPSAAPGGGQGVESTDAHRDVLARPGRDVVGAGRAVMDLATSFTRIYRFDNPSGATSPGKRW